MMHPDITTWTDYTRALLPSGERASLRREAAEREIERLRTAIEERQQLIAETPREDPVARYVVPARVRHGGQVAELPDGRL